jgi:hypothetical protein
LQVGLGFRHDSVQNPVLSCIIFRDCDCDCDWYFKKTQGEDVELPFFPDRSSIIEVKETMTVDDVSAKYKARFEIAKELK